MGHTPSPNHHYRYALHQWLPLMMPNAFTDLDQAVNFGVAVDRYDIGWQEEEPHFILHADVAARRGHDAAPDRLHGAPSHGYL
jgi:hypothetical protein